MTEILELSDHNFKTTIINMLRVLIDTVDSVQEPNAMYGEMEILRKNQKNIKDKKHCNDDEECL